MSRFRYDPESWHTVKDHYTIDEQHVVHGPFTFDEWMEWAIEMEDFDEYSRLCIVGRTRIDGDCQVMTDFVRGLHLSPWRKGPPILFETMVFRDGHGCEEERYATWAEAEAGHQRMVDLVMQPSEASDTRSDAASDS